MSESTSEYAPQIEERRADYERMAETPAVMWELAVNTSSAPAPRRRSRSAVRFGKPRRSYLIRCIREGVRKRPAAILRFQELIPDFGRRPLSLKDFVDECDRRDITFYFSPMKRLHGFCWRSEEDGNMIALNSNLVLEALEDTAFHELAHLLLHPCDRKRLAEFKGIAGFEDSIEIEARAIAAIASHPELVAEAMKPTARSVSIAMPAFLAVQTRNLLSAGGAV